MALTLYNRPRKTLSCKTPAEAMTDYLESARDPVLRRPVESAQYTCGHFQPLLKDHGITCSMSRAGEVGDNSAMETAMAPCCSSMRMSAIGTGAAGAGKLSGTNKVFDAGAFATGAGVVLTRPADGVISTSCTQRRSMLESMPWAIATAAIEMPGRMQAGTALALNPSLCLRRRRRAPAWLSGIVLTGSVQVGVDTTLLCRRPAFKMGWLDAHHLSGRAPLHFRSKA